MTCRRVCTAWLTWLAFNLLLARPLFRWLNKRALESWRCPVPADRAEIAQALNASGLEVVVASVGRTGTTSMQAALELMGIRTYKRIELSFYLPDLVRNATSAGAALGVGSTVQSCAVKALVPEPLYALTATLVQMTPGIKVIFTWRDWQQVHHSSRRALVSPWLLGDLLAPLLCDWLPYGFLWPNADLGHSFLDTTMSSLLFDHCRQSAFKVRPAYGPFSQHMNSKNISERKAAVLEYYSHLRSLVPPGSFLDFDYQKHGWPDLEAFLGRPTPSAPFPKLRSKTISRIALKWEMNPSKYCAFCLIMLGTVLVNALLSCAAASWLRCVWAHACRRGRAKQS